MALPWAIKPPSWISAGLILTSTGKRHDLDKSDTREFRLGRLQPIQIEHQTASRLHAIIAHHKDGGLYIVDQKSANGTFLDGKEIPPNTPTRLRHGTILRFGECPDEFKVELIDRKQDMASQLAGYDDDDAEDHDLCESGATRFVSGGSRLLDSSKERRRDSGPHSYSSESSQKRQREFSSFSGSAPTGQTKTFSQSSHPPVSSTGTGVSALAEKRKMLWGSKAKEENARNTATWSSLSNSLGDTDKQGKFMKLMGGGKAANQGTDGAAGAEGVPDFGRMQVSLQREYESALHRSQGNSKHGLG
jgi:pSer/pThr/pTyr-binding forkhead associated (FHA) protein